MVCVSLVPPGTLKPPPAQMPRSQGWPSSGLDCAAKNCEPNKIEIKITPRRHGDTEKCGGRTALKFINSPGSTKESIRSKAEGKMCNLEPARSRSFVQMPTRYRLGTICLSSLL